MARIRTALLGGSSMCRDGRPSLTRADVCALAFSYPHDAVPSISVIPEAPRLGPSVLIRAHPIIPNEKVVPGGSNEPDRTYEIARWQQAALDRFWVP